LLNNVVCMHTGDRAPLRWTREWKVADQPVRVDVYRQEDVCTGPGPTPRPRTLFEVYCPDEAAAEYWASSYEQRGFLAEVVLRGE
jgi:hypothetical protein